MILLIGFIITAGSLVYAACHIPNNAILPGLILLLIWLGVLALGCIFWPYESIVIPVIQEGAR